MTEQPSLAQRLAEPFDPAEVKWKPQIVRSTRALAVAYVDARAVMDRLDKAVGVGNWRTSYQSLPGGGVVCTLAIRVDVEADEWVEKSDVGSQSDQPDEGDRVKSAFSDALKRAAVQWGIGRYLYRIPQQWVDYDGQTRQIKQAPALPDWAKPPGGPAAGPAGPRAAGRPAASYQDATTATGTAPPPPISAAQWEQLKAALAGAGVRQRVLLEHFHVARPSELTVDRFPEALRLAKSPPKEWLPAPAADTRTDTRTAATAAPVAVDPRARLRQLLKGKSVPYEAALAGVFSVKAIEQLPERWLPLAVAFVEQDIDVKAWQHKFTRGAALPALPESKVRDVLQQAGLGEHAPA